MRIKVSPVTSRILFLLSVSNLLIMFICIFIAKLININIQSNTMPIFSILVTLLNVLLGYLSRAIYNSVLIFVLVNCLLSILMGLAAWLISRSLPNPTTLNKLKFAQAKK